MFGDVLIKMSYARRRAVLTAAEDMRLHEPRLMVGMEEEADPTAGWRGVRERIGWRAA